MNFTKQGVRTLAIANIHWIALAAIALVLFFYLMAYVDGCNTKREEKKTAEQKAEINEGKGEVKQIEEQKNETKIEVNAAEQDSAAAANNAAAVVNTDASTRSASRAKARAEWCKDHPESLLCQ